MDQKNSKNSDLFNDAFRGYIKGKLKRVKTFGKLRNYRFHIGKVASEAVAQRCSVKKVFLEISQN